MQSYWMPLVIQGILLHHCNISQPRDLSPQHWHFNVVVLMSRSYLHATTFQQNTRRSQTGETMTATGSRRTKPCKKIQSSMQSHWNTDIQTADFRSIVSIIVWITVNRTQQGLSTTWSQSRSESCWQQRKRHLNWCSENQQSVTSAQTIPRKQMTATETKNSDLIL
jgi:hypothetical protein